MEKLKVVFVILVLLLYSISQAQNCYLDLTFNSPSLLNITSEGTRAIALQPDGKIIIGGDFSIPHYGIAHYNIDRLNADGSFDPTFNTQAIPPGPPGPGPNQVGIHGYVSAIAIQPDGKILVGGCFDKYNGATVDRIIRLHPNGDLDTTFKITPFQGVSCTINSCYNNGHVYNIALQPDGKILIAGANVRQVRNNFQSCEFRSIARLNIDGSYDLTFDSLTTFVGGFLMYQGNGKLLTRNTGTVAPFGLTRLFSDGSKDTTFNIGGVGTNQTNITKVIQQTDGKLIIIGNFSYYNQTAISKIARLNSDGTLDTTFMHSINVAGGIEDVALDPSGKILVVGWFDNWGGSPKDCIVRLNTDGSLDLSFNPASLYPLPINEQIDGEIRTVVVQPDSKVIIGGDKWYYGCVGQTDRYGIARLLPSFINGIQRIEESSSCKVKIIPNPFVQNTTLQIAGIDKYESINFTLFDIHGRQVKSVGIINSPTYELVRDNLADGVYYYILSQNGNLLSNGKLVILD